MSYYQEYDIVLHNQTCLTEEGEEHQSRFDGWWVCKGEKIIV